jgi:predicted PurR-regulated permease PerM
VANRRLTTISYIIVALVFILAGWLQLGTMLVTALFSYFALRKLSGGQRKWVPIALFLVLVVVVLYGFGFFAKQAIKAMPHIVQESAPVIVDYAEKRNIPIPFTDAETLKATIVDFAKDEIHFFGNFAKVASRGFILLVMGFVVALSLFLNSTMDLDPNSHRVKNNCYSVLCTEILNRFRSLYHSFDLVLGAQLVISLINTTLTAIYLIAVGMPYAWMIVVATFLCGLLPIVGNLISNTIIVGVAFTKSPQLALASLIFLIVVHKLEYFLNSKIIGNRIKNPVWLTLVGIILGERLLGIPGMILAPVVLHFVKQEMSRIEVALEPEKTDTTHDQDLVEKK